MAKTNKKWDVIIFGATGFTGTLVAEYFAEHVDFKKVKWAIGGRNASKLHSVKNKLVAKHPELFDLEIFVADQSDESSLEKMTQSAKVIITTVGPYTDYGEPLVKACIENKTHCLDLTGEPEYVKHIYKHYNYPAERNETLIIHSCGFDSVPSDLGAFYTAQLLGTGDHKSIECFVSAHASFSGGTFHSAMKAMEDIHLDNVMNLPYTFGSKSFKGIHYQKSIGKWAIPMPVVDPLIVSRSSRSRVDVFGNDFSYAQYISVRKPLSAGILLAGVGALAIASKIEPLKEKMLQFKKSGDGPSEEEREKSRFKLIFIGKSANKTVRTSVSGGDPGYTETSKMISEAALTIIEITKDFKGKGGVMTPAGILGEKYLQRLKDKGIQFEEL